jgi:Peptidase family M28
LTKEAPNDIKTPLNLLTSAKSVMILALRVPDRTDPLNLKLGPFAERTQTMGVLVTDHRWPAWSALIAALIVAWFAIQAQQPPAPLPADASPALFAAGRAQKHVEAIARAPHPMGSDESVRVRETLIDRLRAIGLDAKVQLPARMQPPFPQNVVARLSGKGLRGKKALMLCAHYDSVPEGPGASDDAAGVAVVLETLRALKAGPPLERDVIALLTDGEESGCQGARVFVNEHPWASDVGIVLNFDARGNSGPSIMFETSDGNGWLIDKYAQAVNQPFATSVSMDIYKFMPNYSDLTVLKATGMGGLNFAFGAGIAYYHTPEDTPENLDPRTLQHQGENALATAQHFGRLDLDKTEEDDVVYTSLLNRVVVSYSKVWTVPLAFLAVVMFLALARHAIRTNQILLLDILVGAAIFLCCIITSLFAVGSLFFLGFCWSSICEARGVPPIPWLKYDVSIMAGCALVSAALTVALTRLCAHTRPLAALVLGAFSWWLALSLASALWLPSASYLFVWPALGGLLGLFISSRFPPVAPVASAASLLGSIPSSVLLAPLIRTTFDGLSLPMAQPVMVLVVLFTGSLMPIWGPIFALDPKPVRLRQWKRSAALQLEVENAS